jgi:hypothetical protein
MDCKPASLFIYLLQFLTSDHDHFVPLIALHIICIFQAGENGCFNIFCSGFVQVNPTYPLGYVLNKISNYGTSDQYVIQCNIYKVYSFI